MKRNLIVILIIIGFAASVSVNIYLGKYWFDSEYPNGKIQHTTNEIRIWNGGWYCDHKFVKIGDVYEIIDYDFEYMIYRELDNYNINYNYSIKYIDDPICGNETEKIITLDDYREVNFEINYHTYDRLLFGNDVSYAKTKVIDSFRISGWYG